MSRQTLALTEPLLTYLATFGYREHEVLARCRVDTEPLPKAGMQVAPEQGALLQMLVRLLGAKRALEVGVFTGYSSLAVALALGEEGRLTVCEINAAYLDAAGRYWQQAGVADRIDVRLGPARETLDELLAGGEAGAYDFAFIDADKESYPEYYDRALRLLRPGGVVAIDNVLWSGRVADPIADDPATTAIHTLNQAIHGDERVDMCLIPIGDGLTLCHKR